jgi:deoxyribodipyrimidine photo-lyase
MTDPRRYQKLNNKEFQPTGPVVYWMSRDQRVHDNWALTLAQEYSKKYNLPLSVVFSIKSKFLDATIRQYDFMIKGLEEVETELNDKNISFFLLEGTPEETIPNFIKKHNVSLLITDFSPLKIGRKWRESIAKKIDIPMLEVDTHNIIPCWFVSNKQEFGAYTLRPKINKLLKEFLVEIPRISKSTHTIKKEKIDWKNVYKKLDVNKEVKPVDWVTPGYKAGMHVLKLFIENKLDKYDELRNDPTKDYQSNLSPYLHFGQVSAQRVALEVDKFSKPSPKEAYLEELIIRKELSDNYCYFNHNYDNTDGFPDWAKKTLAETKNDKREYVYTKHELENSKTHDPLWNAAQNQMRNTGKMHGYLRMYWAKKLLEWTKTPEDALEIGIYLNDKYELDGRDPSGYTGLAWSIGGVHDRAWFPRPVFGKIRYMNYNGCKSKFDVEKYIKDNQ